MLDILELEHNTIVERPSQPIETEKKVNNRLGEGGDIATDADPLQLDTKLSPFRRASIHLLTVVMRSLAERGTNLEGFPLRRAGIVLRYIASNDEDRIVRVMASEASELLSGLEWFQEVGDIHVGV